MGGAALRRGHYPPQQSGPEGVWEAEIGTNAPSADCITQCLVLGESEKHLLARSISHFDPTATLAPSKIFRRIGPPEVFQISSLDGYTGAF